MTTFNRIIILKCFMLFVISGSVSQDLNFDFTTQNLSFWQTHFGIIETINYDLPNQGQLTSDGLILMNRSGYGTNLKLRSNFKLYDGWAGDILIVDEPYNSNWCGGMTVYVRKVSDNSIVHQDTYYTIGSGYKSLNISNLTCTDPQGYYLEVELRQGYGTGNSPINRLKSITVTNYDQNLNSSGLHIFPGNVGIGTVSPKAKLDVRGITKSTQLMSGLITSYEPEEGVGQNSTNGEDLVIRAGRGTGAGYNGSIHFQVGHGTNQGNQQLKGIIHAMTVERNTGNIGIGTNTPSTPLEVAGKIKTTNLEITGAIGDYTSNTNVQGTLTVRKDNHAEEIANFGNTNGGVGLILKSHYDGNGAGTDLVSRGYNVNGYGDFRFYSLNGTYTNQVERMRIDGSGNVGIGTSAPTQKLSVAGKINAEELILEDVQGADFVFEEDYDLRSLEETEQFIKANKHLPEIPSAAEMAEEGLEIKEMNILLLQKVEELTLHLIRMEKRDQQLSKELTELKVKLNNAMTTKNNE